MLLIYYLVASLLKCAIIIVSSNSVSKDPYLVKHLGHLAAHPTIHIFNVIPSISYSCSCIQEGYWKDGKLHGRGRSTDNTE